MNPKQIQLPTALLSKIASGNTALFIGAGASIPAGLPSGQDLTDRLKNQFPDCNQEITNFMDICQDIEETPPYNRSDLEQFIIDQLSLFQPTPSHRIFTKYNWSAVFTTNFDSVIETTYRTTPERLKNIQTISKASPSVNISDRTRVYLFKMMGTQEAEDDSSSGMVLTRSDYHESITKRNQYLKLLGDYIKSGTILYIGYSFKDQIAKDVINQVTKIYGHAKLPWSYMLLREIPTDEKSQYFFTQNKITPIEGDFESFFTSLDQQTTANNTLSNKVSIPIVTLKIHGKEIAISESNYNMYSTCFDFISENNLYEQCSIKEFLQGNVKCWDAFKNVWDFKRQAYCAKDPRISIKATLNEEASNIEADKNRILYITGMPGCGKSMLTYRLAYDYYADGKGPVLFLSKKNGIDFKIIATFIEDINGQYDNMFKENEKVRTIKPMIIFDEVSHSLNDLLRLKDYLISRGRASIILANGRDNELKYQAKENNINISPNDEFVLNEKLTSEESKAIIEYLYKYKFITSKAERWEHLIEETYGASIFATFYSLVHPSKKPLAEIIKDQYNNLSPVSQKTFLIICSFSQYDISVNIELIVRTLDISYEDFYNILSEVTKIIFEEFDYNGNVVYKAHHKIIAHQTINFFIDKSKLFQQYIHTLKASLLYNNTEREIIERFLIENFSKDAKSDFTLAERCELFATVCDNTPTRSLAHHLGLLQMDLGNYPAAEDYLLDAIDLPREESEIYRGESDQNILTSLGKLNSLAAQSLYKGRDWETAKEKFDLAESYFNEAKHGEYPNAYAYHANAYMWFQKGKQDLSNDSKEAFADSISKSLAIINLAKDNLNIAELQPLIELEGQIYHQLDDEQKIRKVIQVLKDEYNSVNGYFISASYYFQKTFTADKYKDLYIDNCVKSLNEALQISPKDEKCLTLKCKVLLIQNKTNDYEMYDMLTDWYANSKQDNAYLLFNYARLAFINELYDKSTDLFEQLQNGVGLGNQRRSKTGNEIIDKDTKQPLYYSGEVTDIYSKTEGRIKLTMGQRVYLNFRPIAAKFNVYRNAPVKFYIAFTYRGPIATNIIKA